MSYENKRPEKTLLLKGKALKLYLHIEASKSFDVFQK